MILVIHILISVWIICMDHISSPKQQRNIVQLCTMELCATKMRERGFPQMFPWFLLKLSYRCILLSTVLLPLLQWHLPRWFSTNGILLLKILNQYFSKIELWLLSNLLEEDLRFCWPIMKEVRLLLNRKATVKKEVLDELKEAVQVSLNILL